MPKEIDEATGSPSTNGTGYKNPPKGNQYKNGQSGNPRRKKTALKSLKEMVMAAASKPVTVADITGKTRKAQAGEVLIERAFLDAIKGRPKSVKELLKLYEMYLPPYEEPPVEPANGGYGLHELTQADADYYRERGFLPAHCPQAIGDISAADLNRAVQASAAASHASNSCHENPCNGAPDGE